MHMKNLHQFLTVIRQSGFTFNIKTCSFAHPEVKFLGRVTGSGRYSPNTDKVATVHGLKSPQMKNEVRQILGFFANFQYFIPGYAEIARCITDLTCKRTSNKMSWTQKHEQAFQLLKSLLCEAVTKTLFIIDYNLPFNISFDASTYAVSCILSETDNNQTEKPIAFTSKRLTYAQIHAWSVI